MDINELKKLNKTLYDFLNEEAIGCVHHVKKKTNKICI